MVRAYDKWETAILIAFSTLFGLGMFNAIQLYLGIPLVLLFGSQVLIVVDKLGLIIGLVGASSFMHLIMRPLPRTIVR